MARRKTCKHGRKVTGRKGCKSKPGRKAGSTKRSSKKSSRKCKKGNLRNPSKSRRCRKVKCSRGKTKSGTCKKKPGRKASSKRSSKRSSKKSYKMSKSIALNIPRSKKSKVGAADEIIEAANNPSKEAFNNLTGTQLNQVCKLFGVKGCSTKSKAKLVNHALKAVNKIKEGPPGIPPNTVKNVGSLGGMGIRMATIMNLANKAGGVYPGVSRKELSDLSNAELDVLCHELNIKHCSSSRKSKKISHIISETLKNDSPAPPRGVLDRDDIMNLEGNKVRQLARIYKIKGANNNVLRGKLLLYHGQHVLDRDEVLTAKLGKLREMCTGFSPNNGYNPGLSGCYTKQSDADSIRNNILAAVDETGTKYVGN